MARIGSFDTTGRAITWFDETAVPEGFFDPDLIPLGSAPAVDNPPNRPTLFANGHQNVLSLGAAIGGAVLFASAVFFPPASAKPIPQPPNYDVGSQRAAYIAGSGQTFGSRVALQTAAAPAPAIRPVITAASQPDLTAPAPLVFKPIPVAAPAQSPPLRPMITAAPQFDPSQRVPLTFSAPPPTTSTQAQPQPPQIDVGSQRSAFTSGWAWLSQPIPVASAAPTAPPLRPAIIAAPQADPSQLSALLFSAPPPSTAPAVQPQPQAPSIDIGGQRSAFMAGWAATFNTTPIPSAAPAVLPAGDLIDQPQEIPPQPAPQVWRPFLSGPPPSPVIGTLLASPQADPTQQQALVFVTMPPDTPRQAPPLAGIIVGQRVEYFEGTTTIWSPSFAPSVTPTPAAKRGGIGEWPLYVWRLKQSEDDLMLLIATALKSGIFD